MNTVDYMEQKAAQPVKFPIFYGTRRFITVFTRSDHRSWARLIKSTRSDPISLRSILILSFHLRLGLPSGLLPSHSPTKILTHFSKKNTENVKQVLKTCISVNNWRIMKIRGKLKIQVVKYSDKDSFWFMQIPSFDTCYCMISGKRSFAFFLSQGWRVEQKWHRCKIEGQGLKSNDWTKGFS
jgi:hypothetical protein